MLAVQLAIITSFSQYLYVHENEADSSLQERKDKTISIVYIASPNRGNSCFERRGDLLERRFQPFNLGIYILHNISKKFIWRHTHQRWRTYRSFDVPGITILERSTGNRNSLKYFYHMPLCLRLWRVYQSPFFIRERLYKRTRDSSSRQGYQTQMNK